MRSCTRSLTAAAMLLALLIVAAPASGARKKSPPPAISGVDHIVVVMMENRSFDHLLGWLPNAEGMQAGLSYTDSPESTTTFSTMAFAPDYMGCKYNDPDHSWEGGRIEYHNGFMDGFLWPDQNDVFAISYYVENDRPFFNALARNYTTCDHFFASIMAETYPNRIFQHAAQTDRLENTLDISTLPTIWDRLAEEGVSANYYFSDVAFLWLWGAKYLPILRTYDQFLADAQAGTLPSVAFVDPRFIDDASGTSGSDHPHANIQVGDAFLAETFHAVANGPNWPNTVFIVTYDEWGGFFEHVPPPRAVAPNEVDPDLVNGKALLGMRVPVVVASPFSRGDSTNPRVSKEVFDHTSVLKLIEWRWHLRPLTARDASTDVGNLVDVLDLTQADTSVPTLPEPSFPVITPCDVTSPVPSGLPLSALLQLAP